MPEFTTKLLDITTWSDFAKLVEDHNGVWGGCWCMAFHRAPGDRGKGTDNRTEKENRVRSGTTHNVLVYDGNECAGWCQFGPTSELPNIKRKKAYAAGIDRLPDWRITCFFVGKGYRGKGVAEVALAAALDEIALQGGGIVESYPEDVEGRKVSSSFLHNGTVAMFEKQGFKRDRKIGKHHWVVVKQVDPVPEPR